MDVLFEATENGYLYQIERVPEDTHKRMEKICETLGMNPEEFIAEAVILHIDTYWQTVFPKAEVSL